MTLLLLLAGAGEAAPPPEPTDRQPTALLFKPKRRALNASGRKDVRVKRNTIPTDPHKGDKLIGR